MSSVIIVRSAEGSFGAVQIANAAERAGATTISICCDPGTDWSVFVRVPVEYAQTERDAIAAIDAAIKGTR